MSLQVELNERELDLILTHLDNSPIPWCMAEEKREVQRLVDRLKRTD
jgi:predicted HAD superfamily phosphohydrolase YqeG